VVRGNALVVSAGAVALWAAASATFLLPACSSSSAAEAGPSCTNGARDPEEIGIDCGGVCATRCTGDGCTTNDECSSGKCEGSACAAPAGKTCGVGAAIPACEDGEACELDKDCKSAFCDGGKCAQPTAENKPPGPTDGKKNNGETDVDCGGPNAPACANGKACAKNEDCTDKYCPEASKVCTAPRYDDGVLNGSETDVDCGGTGPGMKKCAEGKTCAADTDCVGACNYKKQCVDVPSCKPHFGGDTCGKDEVRGAQTQESCCRTLPVPGFTDPANPGKTVYLDKFEITAGRVRAFIEDITKKQGGAPNVKAWIAANPPKIWGGASWAQFLPSAAQADTISVPHKPTSEVENPPWFRNTGIDYQFNQQLFVYVHGHNCGNEKASYGFPTFFYPAAIQTLNGGLARANPTDGVNIIPAQEALDVKSMNCITGAMLQAFCHWDGGQLATDEVLDFVTGTPPNVGSAAGCGGPPSNRCAPVNAINASSDSGVPNQTNYYFPYYDNQTANSPASHEGTSRISAPGRKMTGGPAAGQQIDMVRINAGDEPWMDLHGNVHEIALDVSGATFTGNFALKYRGIGFSSARAGGNSATGNLQYPEYKAGYSGGRCMRFK